MTINKEISLESVAKTILYIGLFVFALGARSAEIKQVVDNNAALKASMEKLSDDVRGLALEVVALKTELRLMRPLHK